MKNSLKTLKKISLYVKINMFNLIKYGMVICMMHYIKHFRTVAQHRRTVIRHCRKAGIFFQGLRHDLSKYSPTEFIEGARFYLGFKSPTEKAREVYGYSRAWMHHKGRNRHHFEYWTDYSPETRRPEPVKMPIRYVKEMFCDRVAAGKVYLGDKFTVNNPIEYFRRGNAKEMMHPETAALLEKWLLLYQQEGENAAFKEIRKVKEY